MCRGCRLSLRQLPSIHCFGLPGISLTVSSYTDLCAACEDVLAGPVG